MDVEYLLGSDLGGVDLLPTPLHLVEVEVVPLLDATKVLHR